jgi:hypothetical protein
LGAEVMSDKAVTIDVEVILDEFDYARDQYKKAVGDQQKDFWDGYLAAIESLCGEVVIND